MIEDLRSKVEDELFQAMEKVQELNDQLISGVLSHDPETAQFEINSAQSAFQIALGRATAFRQVLQWMRK